MTGPTISPALPTNIDCLPTRTDGVGIDTIKVRGPLAKQPDFSKFKSVKLETHNYLGDRFESTAWTPIGGIRLGVARSSDIGPCATWEVSLPTLRDSHNLYPVSYGEAMTLLKSLYVSATEFVEWKVPIEQFSVSRLDTARDFTGITDIPGLLQALGHLPIPGKAQRSIWASSSGIHGLGVGVRGRWRAQLYDKQKELARRRRSAVDPMVIEDAYGILRFEVRTWRAVNRVKVFSTVQGLSAEVIETHNESYFNRCDFDQVVGGYSRVVEAIHSSLDESDTDEMAKMLGYLHFEAVSGVGPYGEVTNRKYKNLARARNLSSADLFGPAASKLRLVHESGLLVVEGYAPVLTVAA